MEKIVNGFKPTTLSLLPVKGKSFHAIKLTDGDSDLKEKLKLALIIGIPVAISAGIIYYLYRQRNLKNSNKSETINEKKVSDTKTKSNKNAKPISPEMAAKNMGNKFFKEAKYEKAIECYTKAIEICPKENKEDLSQFYQNRGASYEMLKNYEKVIEDCTKAIELQCKYVKALLRRARAYETLKDYDNALVDIAAVCIVENFLNSSTTTFLERLIRQSSKNKAREFIKSRQSKMPSKYFIRHYFMSFTRDPIVENAKELDEDKLNQLLNQLVESGDQAKIALLKGTLEVFKGKFEIAEKHFEDVIAMDCDKDIKVNALIKLGNLTTNDLENAMEAVGKAMGFFEQAINLDANNPDIYIHRAQILILTEQVDIALSDLEKCCSLAKDFPSAFAQKLYVHFKNALNVNDSNGVKESLQNFDNALVTFPDCIEIFSLYAQALMEIRDFDKADNLFLKAIESDPNDASLYVHRGILQLSASSNIFKARELFEKALNVDSKCGFAYEMLANIEVQQGNLKRGVELFDGALQLTLSEMDATHIYSLHDAAVAQIKASQLLGIQLPS